MSSQRGAPCGHGAPRSWALSDQTGAAAGREGHWTRAGTAPTAHLAPGGCCGIALWDAATLLTAAASGVIQGRWGRDVTRRQRTGRCSARCHLEFNSGNARVLGAGLRAPPPTAQRRGAADFRSLSMFRPWPESPARCLGLTDTTVCQPLTTLGQAATWAAQGPRSGIRGAWRRRGNPPRPPGRAASLETPLGNRQGRKGRATSPAAPPSGSGSQCSARKVRAPH